MIKDRLLIEDLKEGEPALWNRNTLSSVSDSKPGDLQNATPTQIVYPNNSLNIGLPVDSINVNNKHSFVTSEDPIYDENNGNHPLIVYSSVKQNEEGGVYKKHSCLLYFMFFYTIFVLYFGQRMKSHIDFTNNSIIFLRLTRISIFNYIIVAIGIIFGYIEILRFNSVATLLFICFELLYIENIYGVMISLVHMFVLLCNYHSIYKTSPKVFMVTSATL